MVHSQNASAQPFIVNGGCANWPNFLGLLNVINGDLVLLYGNVPVRPVDINLVREVINHGAVCDVLVVHQNFKQVTQNLDSLFDFPLNEVEHSLCEVFVHLQSLAAKVVVDGSLKAEVSFVKVFLRQPQLGNREQSVSAVELVLRVLRHLLEVQDCVICTLLVLVVRF